MFLLLFYLLSNEFPFKEDNFYSLQENILSCNYQFMPKENWKDKSNQVKQLIKKLLLLNDSKNDINYITNELENIKNLNYKILNNNDISNILTNIFTEYSK